MKKILLFIALLFIPVFTFASEATCKYEYANIELTINYKYGQKLMYSGTKFGNTSFGTLSGVEVSHIVDSSGNISCPTLYAKKSISGQKRFDVDFTINNISGYTAVDGDLNITVQDDAEIQSPDSNTHTCIYKKDTDSEYVLTWNGSEVVVTLTGSRYDNFCPTQITQSEWNASMFANGKCPTEIYDQVVARYENLSNCKGRLIVSTKTILTDDDQTTDVGGSENVYDGTENDDYKGPTTSEPSDYVDKINYNSLCENRSIKQTMKLIGYLVQVARWIVPLIIIVFGMIDFGKASIESDDKALNKATASLIRRIVAGVVVFFIPTIILGLLNAIEITKGIEDESNSQFGACTKCIFGAHKAGYCDISGGSTGGTGGDASGGGIHNTGGSNLEQTLK